MIFVHARYACVDIKTNMISIKIIYLISVYTSLSYAQIGKSSVTFVIDDTKSMAEDINQVKYGVTKIFDKVTSCNDSLVEDFILVTFNDHKNSGHEPRCLVKTLDKDIFIDKLSQITVGGGGDCPEMALSGIELALTESQPGSYIYVFTDAKAKDNWLVEKVQNLAIRKRSQIVFIVTAGPIPCAYPINDPQYLVYHQLADATSGQVFHMVKNDVGAILVYVTQTMEKRKEQIFRQSFPPGYGHEFQIIVDGAMKDMLISESGNEPVIEVMSIDGIKLEFESVVDITDALVLKITDPKPGKYKAKVGSKTSSTVVVTAESSVIFNYGFSAGVEPTSCDADETSTMPVAGVNSYLAIQLITEDEVTLDTVQFIDINGIEIVEIPLKLINDEKHLYVTVEEFMPPEVLFKIAINGLHEGSNTIFTRLSRTAIEVQKVLDKVEVMSLNMEIDKGYHIKVNKKDPLKLVCKVKGYPKPEIIWVDETGKVLSSEVATVNIPYDHIAILEIEKVTSDITLKCEANNINGAISQIIRVEVEANVFSILEKPKDTSIEFMKSGKVSCKVNANPTAKIIWKVGDVLIQTNDEFEILEDSNDLVIKQMLPDLVGKYACLANNYFESVLMQFQLTILETVPIVSIDSPSIVDADYDESLTLYCRATGYPEPILAWYDETTGEELLSFAIAKSPKSYKCGRELKIEQVNRNAIYKCKASNPIGEVSATVTVETLSYFRIIEAPKDTRIEYKKDGEVLCKVEARPRAEIKWLFKRNILTKSAHFDLSADNTTLTIIDMQPGMIGYYTCLVMNKNNFTNFVFKVGISGLIRPVIDRTVEILNVLEGSTAHIDCIVLQGTPMPTISWMFKADNDEDFIEIDVTTNFIHIENVKRDQCGSYRCVASNPLRDSHTVYLSVEFPPTIETTEERVRAEDGKDVTLHCVTDGMPEPRVTWFFNELLIVSGREYTIYRDNSIWFKASPSQAGTFKCIATNIHGTASISTQVDYFVPVIFEIPKETTIEIQVGEDVTLPCAVDGYPPPTIMWFFFSTDGDENEPPKVLRTAVSPDTLVLRQLQTNQDGEYTCVARNGPSEKNMTYSVHVQGKPKIIDSVPYTTIHAVAGDLLVSVPCKAIGRPAPNITWINEKGFNIAAGTKWNDVDEDGSLIFKNIDKGSTVTCIAENQYGSDRKTFNVVVHRSATPTSPVSEHRVKIGEPAEIRCPLAHTEVDSVRWYIDGRLMTTSEDQLLKFNKVASHDKGLYTCRVSSLTSPAMSATIQITPTE